MPRGRTATLSLQKYSSMLYCVKFKQNRGTVRASLANTTCRAVYARPWGQYTRYFLTSYSSQPTVSSVSTLVRTSFSSDLR